MGPDMRRFALSLCLLLVPLAAAALEINTATRAQLEQLSGVGVTTADRILKERSKRPFTGWDDLHRRVKGLSGTRMQQWQTRGVTVNGQRGISTAPAPAAPAESKEPK